VQALALRSQIVLAAATDESSRQIAADEKLDEVIVKALETKPTEATHWSTRSMAREVGTQTGVHHIWQARAQAAPAGGLEAVR
jgi:hypothetical protein